MNIYGHFYIWYHDIHYVTFIGMVILGLVYLYRLRNLSGPISLKILLPCAYIFAALVHYEVVWNLEWLFYYPPATPTFVGFLLCEVVLMCTIWLIKDKYKYNVPQVSLIRWVIVTGIMIVMILWLNSTGFYNAYQLFYLGLSTVDPHNFVWAVGKLVCLLSWLWIPNSGEVRLIVAGGGEM